MKFRSIQSRTGNAVRKVTLRRLVQVGLTSSQVIDGEASGFSRKRELLNISTVVGTLPIPDCSGWPSVAVVPVSTSRPVLTFSRPNDLAVGVPSSRFQVASVQRFRRLW